MRALVGVAGRAAAAVPLLLALSLASVTPALADHETRDMELQQAGINYWLFAGVMVLVFVGLVLFAAVVLWWERRDPDVK